jgi:hypothetical protein
MYNRDMKILYISPNQRTQQFPWLIDYQNDSLLCGLKELYGDDVVDCNKKYNLYTDYSDDDVKTEYGRGFTFTRLLDSDNADREDIRKKIANKFFDLVVYGSIWRCQDYMDLVQEHYDHNKIIMVDGEDSPKFSELIKLKGLYFKRELMFEHNQEFQEHFWKVSPIQFSFPTMKLKPSVKKERKLAHSDPRDKKTYTFEKEYEYYHDYQYSKFAITMQKAGWDALRHYEIIANGCIPLFINLPNAPRYCMYRFPKALLTKILFFYEFDTKWLDKMYDEYANDLHEHFMKFHTTKANATFFLKDIRNYK